jgi:hypothetical protein
VALVLQTACYKLGVYAYVQIYTQMSKLLGKVFFPSNDPVLQVGGTDHPS